MLGLRDALTVAMDFLHAGQTEPDLREWLTGLCSVDVVEAACLAYRQEKLMGGIDSELRELPRHRHRHSRPTFGP